MKLKDASPGTIVSLESGQIVVTAVGPGRGRRYVMQSSGMMLDTSANQTIEIISTSWSAHLAPLIIRTSRHLLEDRMISEYCDLLQTQYDILFPENLDS